MPGQYFRPTISPYGILAPCDLKAEPRFTNKRFSSRTGNSVYHKLLTDLRDGMGLAGQPFALDGTMPVAAQ